jgi:hypothetical protein
MIENPLKVINGRSMHLLGKLINDFDPIFCQADRNSICFIGARDHLEITIKINRERYSSKEDRIYTYIFKSSDVGRNIEWFKTKANSRKRLIMTIIPKENHLEIHNKFVDGKFISFINDAPIPAIQEMGGGILLRITNLREMVEQVNSVVDNIVKLEFSNLELTMCGADHADPIYKIPTGINETNAEIGAEKVTFCLKPVLLASTQLISELGPRFAELRFYPGGAIQINAENGNLSAISLLTAVKHL